MTFQNPTHECDVVMKGGITSGVVYPKAILEIARKYRLKRLGGTSAGAIAAAFAAAAEMDRAGGGFERLAKIPAELNENLIRLFQPLPRHRKSFDRALKLYRKGVNPVSGPLRIVWSLRKLIGFVKTIKRLPQTNFGICPGTSQPGYDFPGLTDWLERHLEALAGRWTSGALPPRALTFGDLRGAGITLRSVTTDLSGKNPVLMPLDDATWYFRESEFRQLFSDRIVDHLVATGEKYEKEGVRLPHEDYYYFPGTDDLPVLLAVRLSLSFPLLLAAVPLYRRDFQIRRPKTERWIPKKCWMSDGGVASNFPIHLFDSPLPARPTFGFSLDEFDPARLADDQDPSAAESRIDLPHHPVSGILRPIDSIDGLADFAAAILDTARNWQDGLQSTLPGYRERIVHIALDRDEGGLNLEMDEKLIRGLTRYGELAGQKISQDFAFQEHQWRRLLSTYAAFEEAFDDMAKSYDAFDALRAEDFEPEFYKEKSKAKKAELWQRMDQLAALARDWNAEPLRDTFRSGQGMPRPRSYLKLVPREQAGVTAGTESRQTDEPGLEPTEE